MKGKILVLIIGILIGAILATGGFIIYNKITSSKDKQVPIQQMMQEGMKERRGKITKNSEKVNENTTNANNVKSEESIPKFNGEKSNGNLPEGEPPEKPNGEDFQNPNSQNA